MQQFARMGFPEVYEQALVGPLFQPWAEHLVQVAGPAPNDRVLDVACGTGIVARLVRMGGVTRVVGIDINPGMVETARSVAPDIEWRVGDAATLPADMTGQFDIVFCQQGLQFCPDPGAVAKELRRVAAPGGRVAVSVWRSDEEMPVLLELRRIAERHVGPIVDRRHSFADARDLEALLTLAGFDNVRVEAITKTMRFPDGSAFVFLNAMAMIGMSAAGPDLEDAARVEVARKIVADSGEVLAAQSDAGGFSYDIGANVATAERGAM